MDSNLLSGGVAELQLAKAAVNEANQLQEALHAAEAAASAKEKDLESQKKYVQDKINNAIKERRGELKKTHDEQVDLAGKNLKEAEKKRKAAKSDAVQARITDETSDFTKTVDDLKREVKTIFKKNRVPGICNNAYYYALYAPKRGIDFVVFVLTIAVAFGVIPNVVCALLNVEKLIVKVLVYLAIVLFFVALYFLIFAISKRNKNGAVLEEARIKRNEIRIVKKQIKKTSKSIVKDKDESTYGLEGYDSEIAGLQQVYNETAKNRDDALKAFDEETTAQIREEIQNENRETLERMEAEAEEARKERESARTKASAAQANVNSTVEVYLGKKNTTVEKIDGMISLIQEGKAKTVMEALDVLNGEIK